MDDNSNSSGAPETGSVIDSSDGSVSGTHPEAAAPVFRAAPTTTDEKNTIRPGLFPIACWRLEDIRFDFDSSFIRPDAAPDVKKLHDLVKAHKKAPLSVFGHADPVGQETYNKMLSGRRAMSVYGMLIRDADIWERLYSKPYSGDNWGLPRIQSMLEALGYTLADNDGLLRGGVSEALKQFQSDSEGLTAHGYLNAPTRKKLYVAYMDWLCGTDFKLEKSAFLAQGADKDGRGDYQGCSEFNPVLIFSKAENKEFSKPENHKQRNAVNAPSRRVMVFLFRRGTKVNPEKWPCPKAETEKVQECRDRFHSDGDKRLENRDKRRTFSQDHDTFACRFYELLATGSPCEEIQDNWVLRVLISGSGPLPGRKPLANEPYILTGVGPKRPEIRGKTDPNGVLRAAVEDDTCKMMLTIAGLKITLDGGALQAMDSGDPAVKERLCNLGYGDADVDSWTDDTYEKALKKFQKDHKLSETGTADADTKQRLKEIHGS
ncbi:MAG: hypothetical protein H6Q05_3215 [Acidobacteria bacterium]|nr:hypothetical protein [Acidobacteriota bacterium]